VKRWREEESRGKMTETCLTTRHIRNKEQREERKKEEGIRRRKQKGSTQRKERKRENEDDGDVPTRHTRNNNEGQSVKRGKKEDDGEKENWKGVSTFKSKRKKRKKRRRKKKKRKGETSKKSNKPAASGRWAVRATFLSKSRSSQSLTTQPAVSGPSVNCTDGYTFSTRQTDHLEMGRG
jgi:hypothetical protein